MRAASVHLCGINPLIQELLQGQHLAAAALGGAACVGVRVERPAQLQGTLVGGARGLLDGAAAAAGPHLLVQAQAELAAALALRPAEAAVQRPCSRRFHKAQLEFTNHQYYYAKIKKLKQMNGTSRIYLIISHFTGY